MTENQELDPMVQKKLEIVKDSGQLETALDSVIADMAVQQQLQQEQMQQVQRQQEEVETE